VEPEFPAHQTVSDLVVSGAVGTLGIQFDSPSSGQRAAGRRALSLLRLTHLAKRPFNKLSQGQRRLAVIARALAMGPELLLLDEATSGLDPVARERFLERIQNLLVQKSDLGTRRNFTPRSFPHSFPLVIYITHHLEEILPGFTHVLLLREGKVVAAGPRKQVLTDELLEKTFAARFTLVSRGGRLWASIRKGSNT
jgi:iron complex transport system ATP-binding protein